MSETRFFRCSHCGNIIGLIHDSGSAGGLLRVNR